MRKKPSRLIRLSVIRRILTSVLLLAGFQAVSPLHLSAQELKFPAVAVVSISEENADFTGDVVGGTRLPDGRIVIGQRRGTHALLVYSASGQLLRRLGRSGHGPGEIGALSALLRCADSLFAVGSGDARVDVFGLDLGYRRRFRFEGQPEATVCNNHGQFLHRGWGDIRQLRPGAYRPMVRYWLSAGDSAGGRTIGMFPGAEHFGLFQNGRPRGAAPLLLGRIPRIALTEEEALIAFGDSLALSRFTLKGKPLAPWLIKGSRKTTSEVDKAKAIEWEVSRLSEGARADARRIWESIPPPAYLPATIALLVDDQGRVWLQESGRASEQMTTWHVFARGGQSVVKVRLPSRLEVLEIRDGFLLGLWRTDEDDVEVHVYALQS